MDLISRNAPQLLLERAKSMVGQHTSWRAIYLNFAELKEQYSEGLRTNVVTNIIKELLEEREGFIYLLDDGDIVLLFKGQVAPVLQKLDEYFKELGDEKGTVHPEDALYSVFDLSKHWNIFYTLCKTKGGETESKPAPVAAAKSGNKTLPELDMDIFKAGAAQRPTRTRPVVLVVEDDPFTRRLVLMTLKADFDVVTAENGIAAIEAYQAYAPDAVFLDIELPDTNGHIILKKLIAADKGAFIVMLSANSMKENVLAALEIGAQGFVTKPFAKEKLMHYLHLFQMAHQRSASA